ncbi:MAG TPA: FHA domain-containing protein [Polyangiaceae bacterium]
MDPGVRRNLLPTALVAQGAASTREAWVLAVDVPLLLVRLDDLAGELARTLAGRPEEGPVPVEQGLAFHTISVDRSRRRPTTIPPPSSMGPEQLLTRIIRAPHFIVPIGKRPDAHRVFSERVTVGRARNSDVVLRHESISKFHAWFARDDRDQYFVVDASSRNGTFKNGAPLDGGDPMRLRSGDVLRFGSVEATFCDAAMLHGALHS